MQTNEEQNQLLIIGALEVKVKQLEFVNKVQVQNLAKSYYTEIELNHKIRRLENEILNKKLITAKFQTRGKVELYQFPTLSRTRSPK